MKAFQPADVIGVGIWPAGSVPEREVVYREHHRWRWWANFVRSQLGWFYSRPVLVIFHVVDPGTTGGHLIDGQL